MRIIVPRILYCLMLLGVLSGCAHTPTEEVRQRDAVQRLGVDAANAVLALMKPLRQPDDAMLVARATIASMPEGIPNKARVGGQRLQDALVRGVLQHQQAPQVVGWAPQAHDAALASTLWRLDSTFVPFAPISLSDRELYPYELTLRLYHPGELARTLSMSGAFDSRALGLLGRRDSRFTAD